MFNRMNYNSASSSNSSSTFAIKSTSTTRGGAWWLMTCTLILCIAAACMVTGSEAKPAPMPPQELADALKVLQQLDRYYSQVARPRFGKRGDVSRNSVVMPPLFGDVNNMAADQYLNEPVYHNIDEWGTQYSQRR